MSSKQTILIIEDTKDLVELLVRRFEDMYDISYALLGRDGLIKAKAFVPDMVLLDVNLPDMSGFEVLEKLKAAPETADIPVLVMTAMSDTESIVQGFDRGAEDYLLKPFNFVELSARVRAHLTIRSLQKSLVDMERLKTLQQLAISFNHEINNPLTAISLFAHVLKSRVPGECEECHESIDGIISEVGRISEKVKKMSAASKAATVDYSPGVKMIDIDNVG
jgi:DNA-binding response OmpR family regulator